MSDNLKTKDCPDCRAKMIQVIGYDYADKPYRQGWYCPDCRAFEKAILRERTVTSADI